MIKASQAALRRQKTMAGSILTGGGGVRGGEECKNQQMKKVSKQKERGSE